MQRPKMPDPAGKARLGKMSRECDSEICHQYLSDPKYTIRAWRAVVTYLLRQEAFLYE